MSAGVVSGPADAAACNGSSLYMSFFWAWVQYSGIVVGFQFGGASKVRREAGHPVVRPDGRRAGRPGGARVVCGAEKKII